MLKNCLFTGLCVLFAAAGLGAQVFPGEGALLNYRIIGFTVPAASDEKTEQIEIAAGSYQSADSFSRNIISTTSCTGGKAIIEAPAFGRQYTWRFVTKDKHARRHASGEASPLYHFSTGWIPEMDISARRMRVIKNTRQYNGDYLFVDGTPMLYDMDGRPVWYLPGAGLESPRLMDMKLSPFGTITFMLGFHAYEVDYAGNVLWKGPDNGMASGDPASEHYHHEFTRLANGHYMILGSDKAGGNAQNPAPPTAAATDLALKNYGNVIEYDDKDKAVWLWKSRDYFEHSDIASYTDSLGRALLPEAHENSFFFDDKTNMLYVGFRNVSRIIKLKYPQGEVLDVFGEIFRKGVAVKNDGIFCRQHACKVMSNGDLCIYNNNDCHWPAPAQVVIARQPQQPGGGLEKVWEFSCNVEGTEQVTGAAGNQFHEQNTSGGNVEELPDGNIFVSMSEPFGNIFIVTRDKKVVWNAVVEKWANGKKEWRPFAHYRASMIASPRAMEHLVWNRPADAAAHHYIDGGNGR